MKKYCKIFLILVSMLVLVGCTQNVEQVESFASEELENTLEHEWEVIMRRFMAIDLTTVEEAKITGEWNSVVRLAELPEYGITMYGYNDEKFSGRGVAIQIGEEVNYFDWIYLTPQCILPEMYWNDSAKQLQVVLNSYTGTGVAAQELHILQQDERGELSDYVLDIQGYSALLEERLDFSYNNDAKTLMIVDKEDNSLLMQADVSWLEENSVENIVAGQISNFRLGEQVWLEFTPGYKVEGWVSPQYEEMPILEVQVKLKSLEEDEFELGKISVIELSDEEMLEQFYEQFYGDLSSEELEELLADRGGYYHESCYYDEITYYWENVRMVTDISNLTNPLYFTDMKYYTVDDFGDATPVVIHLAKNEIYAKHGYIFKSEDLNNYFLGCAWYTPLYTAEEFDDSVFNDFEKKNLEILSELDKLSSANKEGVDEVQPQIGVEAGWEFLKSVYFQEIALEEKSYDENGNFQVVLGRTTMPFSEDDIDRLCVEIVFFDGEEDGYYLFGHYYVFYEENGDVFATRTLGWYEVDCYTGGMRSW